MACNVVPLPDARTIRRDGTVSTLPGQLVAAAIVPGVLPAGARKQAQLRQDRAVPLAVIRCQRTFRRDNAEQRGAHDQLHRGYGTTALPRRSTDGPQPAVAGGTAALPG